MSKKKKKHPVALKEIASAFVKIHKSTLDFIERMCKRWEEGDQLGALVQACIMMEVLLFGMFLGALLVHLMPGVDMKSTLHMILIIMSILFLVIVLVALHRIPDDKRLAKGQAMRMDLINPTPLYQAT